MKEIILVPTRRFKYMLAKKEQLEDLPIRLEKPNSVVVETEDPEAFFKTKDIVKAIARGFSIATAKTLLNPDYMLMIIDLEDFLNTPNAIRRIKARIIGREGSIKLEIQRATDSLISVHGNTVAIIAPFYSIYYAKTAVEKIIHGAKHSSVLNYLARVREELMYTKMAGFKHEQP
jgi:KH domain-containing protein